MGVELKGIDEVIEHLNKQEARLITQTEYKEKATMLAVVSAQEVFSGNPLGWKELDPDTIKRKGSSQILVQTGKLRDTIQPVIGADFVGAKYKMRYGFYHQTGKGVTQRKIGLTPKALKAFHDLALKYLGLIKK